MNTAGITIPYVFVLTGSSLSIYGIFHLIRAWRVRTWPSCAGKILQSRVEVITQHDFMDTYKAVISYEYIVNGKSFPGSHIFLGMELSGNLNTVQKYVNAYPEGATVNVLYDPVDPARAVLDKKVIPEFYLPLLFGLIITATTLFILAMLTQGV